MATNLAIDPDLLDRALAIGGERTKKATVTAALEEYIARRAQAEIIKHRGTLDWDDDFDYKESRRDRDRRLGLSD
ncbi:MAG: type II toxin-antitoxin system VapB family antitoxin [Microthrixaceae bacterium]